MQRDSSTDGGVEAVASHVLESTCFAACGASYPDSISKSALFFVGPIPSQSTKRRGAHCFFRNFACEAGYGFELRRFPPSPRGRKVCQATSAPALVERNADDARLVVDGRHVVLDHALEAPLAGDAARQCGHFPGVISTSATDPQPRLRNRRWSRTRRHAMARTGAGPAGSSQWRRTPRARRPPEYRGASWRRPAPAWSAAERADGPRPAALECMEFVLKSARKARDRSAQSMGGQDCSAVSAPRSDGIRGAGDISPAGPAALRCRPARHRPRWTAPSVRPGGHRSRPADRGRR